VYWIHLAQHKDTAAPVFTAIDFRVPQNREPDHLSNRQLLKRDSAPIRLLNANSIAQSQTDTLFYTLKIITGASLFPTKFLNHTHLLKP